MPTLYEDAITLRLAAQAVERRTPRKSFVTNLICGVLRKLADWCYEEARKEDSSGD